MKSNTGKENVSFNTK